MAGIVLDLSRSLGRICGYGCKAVAMRNVVRAGNDDKCVRWKICYVIEYLDRVTGVVSDREFVRITHGSLLTVAAFSLSSYPRRAARRQTISLEMALVRHLCG